LGYATTAGYFKKYLDASNKPDSKLNAGT